MRAIVAAALAVVLGAGSLPAQLPTDLDFDVQRAAPRYNRIVVPVAAVRPGSLENVVAQLDSVPAVFVDLAHQRPEPGNAWMFQRTPALDWGTMPLNSVPREQFDGILLVRDAHPPHDLY